MRLFLLIIIMMAGFLLRAAGADWGFPFFAHPDELVVADKPFEMAQRKSLDTDHYGHPDHVNSYIHAVVQHSASLIVFHKPLTKTFGANKPFFYLLSRILTALFGTLCIAAAYFIGIEYNIHMGIFAAMLFAVFPPYVKHSHFITPDVLLTFFFLLVTLFSIKYVKRLSTASLFAACLFSALATGVKYPGLLGLTFIMIVLATVHYKNVKQLAASAAKAVFFYLTCLFVSAPYLFIHFSKVKDAIVREASPYHLGADGLGMVGNLLFYAKSYVLFTGPFLLFFLGIGVILLVKQEGKYAVPLLFGYFFWLVMSKLPLHFERWALPMYIAPLLCSAYGIHSAYRIFCRFGRKSIVLIASMVAIVLSFLNMTVNSAALASLFTLKDTRIEADHFSGSHNVTKDNTLYEGYTPFDPGRPRIIFRKPIGVDTKYIMVSSYMYHRYLDEPLRYQKECDFYRYVFRRNLVKEFIPVPEYSAITFQHTKAGSNGLSYFELENITKGVKYLARYLIQRDMLLSGPAIKIYSVEDNTNLVK